MTPAEKWPTLNDLANNQQEADRRRTLRSHLEEGVGGDAHAIRTFLDRTDPTKHYTRGALDNELGKLAMLELRIECGREPDREIHDNAAFQTLAGSAAFGQYLNTYLYFSIRFAAGRLPAVPNPKPGCNEPALALPKPPPIERAGVDTALEHFEELRDADQSHRLSALRFLDDFGPDRLHYELWLRGLYTPPADGQSFKTVTQELLDWAHSRYRFYGALEQEHHGASTARSKEVRAWLNGKWEEGGWRAENPLAARCGVVDLYWLAQLLRAEVSPRGSVVYKNRSWLSYIASHEDPHAKDEILKMEEVLREVFGYACELIQNAVEISEELELRTKMPDWFVSNPPPETKGWRQTFDEELEEIDSQRGERQLSRPIPCAVKTPAPDPCADARAKGWSTRVCSGKDVGNLVGLAFSGGGIRSATFNLGVLQGLKDRDLLRNIDLLSTVSGGGYIGAWLLGNVRRTHYWLSRLTNWEASIAHLRRYSDYLAPHNGLMSVDTWTMWGTWLRNASLIQLSAAVWLMFLLVFVLLLNLVFEAAGTGGLTSRIALIAVMAAQTWIFRLNLVEPTDKRGSWTPIAAALLAWAGSFLAAALFWNLVHEEKDHELFKSYSWILKNLWSYDGVHWLLAALFVSMLFIVWYSVARVDRVEVRIAASPGIALPCVAVMYLAFCGIARLLAEIHDNIWYCYVFGPSLTVASVTISVVLFIGLVGRTAPDWNREWWTRFGAVVGILGTSFIALSLAAVFGPYWAHKLYTLETTHTSIKWGPVLAWLATVISGLLAGNSPKTSGRTSDPGSSKILQAVAAVAACVFIAGAILAVSTGLNLLLALIFEAPLTHYWRRLDAITHPWWRTLVVLLLFAFIGWIFSRRFEINIFGLNQFYRNRLVRCYLGATRWLPGMRKPHPFTGFDQDDDLPLADLRHEIGRTCNEPYRGPFPIVNCTLNLGGSSDLSVHTRHSASFALTPLRCGFARNKGGFSPTMPGGDGRCYAGGISLGQAVAVSGAAASPNMGYNTSPLVAFLLTMFNVRLGWWFPNPAGPNWTRQYLNFSLVALIRELFGMANETGRFVNISDGGHFENLGIYELVRRRTRVIIASDAECDPALAFGSLGNVIRICETDFGAKIDLDIGSIQTQADPRVSRSHCAVGRIYYSNGSRGYLIYLKASITGDESPDISQYRATHPDFPHETTADQFFSEDQFESYRRLGYHIVDRTFRDVCDERTLYSIASRLFDLWAPAGLEGDAFNTQSQSLDKLWERLRISPSLETLSHELTGVAHANPIRIEPLTNEETCVCLEVLQLMECVFLDLRLDDFWDHPDNRGWAMLFSMWAKSPALQSTWQESRQTFGIRFEYFCWRRLGLAPDHPVVRA